MFNNFACLRKLLCAGLLGLSVLGMGAASARADECYRRHHHEWVRIYETRLDPYTYYVTRYDSCGCPYQSPRIGYRTVRVPVWKRVRVCDLEASA